AGGTRLLAELQAGAASGDPRYFHPYAGEIYFQADDGVEGVELWASGPDAGSARRVADIAPGAGDSAPVWFEERGGTLYFRADDGEHGFELWRTGGSAETTELVADIDPGAGSSGPSSLHTVGREHFFVAYEEGFGSELFKTDGTPAGTRRVADLWPGSPSGIFHWQPPVRLLTPHGGGLFFACNDGETGSEPCFSDGSRQGTGLLRDLAPAVAGSAPGGFVEHGGAALFTAVTASSESELLAYRPDAGVGRLQPDSLEAAHSLTPFAGEIYFVGGSELHGRELWRTDGTTGGTEQVLDIAPGEEEGSPYFLTPAGDLLFFSAADGIHGRELWASDGTSQGTAMVRDIDAGSAGSNPWYPAVSGERLFFGAVSDHASGLWASDGTAAGTFEVRTTGGLHLGVARVAALPDGVLVAGSGGIWRAEFAPYSASLVRSFAGLAQAPYYSDAGEIFLGAGERVFFAADDGALGHELWVSDGTSGGTQLLADIAPGPASGWPFYLTWSDGLVFFSADDGVSGRELWVSDGTPAGTRRVLDVAPGADSSAPRGLAAIPGGILFSAWHPETGRELWLSDGTAAGTRLALDAAPGPASSSPEEMALAAGRWLFSIADPAIGRELAVAVPSATLVPPWLQLARPED
ncbi:MAG: hypothetical protein OEP45_15180, partial [Acidobacteriota bacterium]|nr:hypothetical protein [Acidobacteriota bacterium]